MQVTGVFAKQPIKGTDVAALGRNSPYFTVDGNRYGFLPIRGRALQAFLQRTGRTPCYGDGVTAYVHKGVITKLEPNRPTLQ